MAVEFKTEHTRKAEYLFAPEDIKVNAQVNGRHELPDIEWLVDSFVKVGQLQSVLIRNDGGTPVLVAGFSRWRAAMEINKRKLTTVPFKLSCRYFKGNEQDAFLVNVAENVERNNTTPLDDAYNIARMERYGMDMDAIAAIYHQGAKWCRDRLALTQLCPEAQADLNGGKLKPSAALHIAKLAEDQQRKALKGNAKGKVTPASIRSVERENAPAKPARPKLRDVREIAQQIAAHDNYPKGVIKSASVDAFCKWLIDYIDGQGE